jgi:hypothetical protein
MFSNRRSDGLGAAIKSKMENRKWKMENGKLAKMQIFHFPFVICNFHPFASP